MRGAIAREYRTGDVLAKCLVGAGVFREVDQIYPNRRRCPKYPREYHTTRLLHIWDYVFAIAPLIGSNRTV